MLKPALSLPVVRVCGKIRKEQRCVEAHLVVSRVMSDAGESLAQWLLITNVPTVEASEIALWYYWRWKIERFFKPLESAGQNLES
ncbi:MAG: hypothetical protein QX189_01575 [Methylococcales bacterium]